jgi:3-phenylpropionate/cinnamic acid dioxygenase small subunit
MSDNDLTTTSAPGTGSLLALQRDNAALREEMAAVLAYESWLLDGDRLEEWQALQAEDLRYVAPVRRKVDDDLMSVHSIDRVPSTSCIFNDGKIQLSLRIKRLRTGYSHFDKPRAVARRLVGNVILLDWDEQLGEVTLASNFMISRTREESETMLFAGQRDDIWARQEDDSWLLRRRLIKLDHYQLPPLTLFF